MTNKPKQERHWCSDECGCEKTREEMAEGIIKTSEFAVSISTPLHSKQKEDTIKPSERIKQIMINISRQTGNDPLEHKIGAIWDYLDEEYEKRNKLNP